MALLISRSVEARVGTALAAVPAVCLLGFVYWAASMALMWIAPALAALTIARERGAGTLDILRTTPLTERSIVLGKLAGCLIRLWPVILLVLLLAPLQAVQFVAGSVSCFPLSYRTLVPLWTVYESAQTGFWGWMLLATGVSILWGWLGLLGTTAFHLAVGLFMSTLVRSAGAAIAASYGVILGVRMMEGILVSFLFPIVMTVALVPLMGADTYMTADQTMTGIGYMALVAMLGALLPMVFEIVGAVLLVQGAIWKLSR